MTGGGLARSSRVRVVAAVVAVLFVTAGAKPGGGGGGGGLAGTPTPIQIFGALLGFMFWAAERPSTRGVTTQPPNTCEGGMGVGATTLNMPLPMPSLRQN